MVKLYKRTIHIHGPDATKRLEYQVEPPNATLAKILGIPVLLVATAIAAVVLSLVFVLLLIPLGVIGFRVWRGMKLRQQTTSQEIIDAEYTVVSRQEKSEDRG